MTDKKDQAMLMYMFRRIPVIAAGMVMALCAGLRAAGPAHPQFNRDVRPILSENCFFCHGQDPRHREAKLRLDLRDEALRDLGGYSAIVPGKPDQSEVIKRLTTHDADEKMPPAKSNRHVSPEQIETIKRWIADGAKFEKHWAFEPARMPEIPAVKDASWPKNKIDRFILSRLEAEGLKPSKETSPEKWLRRAGYDLTGLPPTPAEIDSFLIDVKARGEPAYGAAVDRLLASDRFGERQAAEWLDAARYADTHGFNNDSARTMWRWRDWVIDSFNSNKRYDQFITEQLAGDLLQNATLDQKLATGFCRNHVINSEGGIIDEEYRVEYVADRVRTLSMAWMGLTLECSKCHDHKFDPIAQKDYYRLFAFFNNVHEYGEDGRVANAVPMLAAPTNVQQEQLAKQKAELASLDKQLQALRNQWKWDDAEAKRVDQVLAAAKKSMPQGIDGVDSKVWKADGTAAVAKLKGEAFPVNGKSGATVSFWINLAADCGTDVPVLSNMDHSGSPAATTYGRGTELRIADGEVEFRAADRFPAYSMRLRSEGASIGTGEWRYIALTYTPTGVDLARVPASTVRMFVDGREVPVRIIHDGLSGNPSAAAWLVGADSAKNGLKLKGEIDQWRTFDKPLTGGQVLSLFRADALSSALISIAKKEANAREMQWLRDAALASQDPGRDLFQKRDGIWESHLALSRQLPSAMVMAEMPKPRETHVLIRGNYDRPGELVEPGVPEALLALWPEGAPKNRLGLAQWLTRPDHPLTARVVVNRWWAQCFGTGICKTVEDFGSQSEWPSHPELLDYLARTFIDNGWDTKALFREIVLSATYRQDSAVTPALIERDPENRLLARGPRVRLPAEIIRDQALAVSGVLKQKIGGPSVYPYQPDDLYKSVVVGAKYPGTTWPTSTGDDLYRRSLYTFWKRTAPHPAMLTFDVPDREFCQVRRSRTNTPLQALTLMNEPGMVEAARELGTRMLNEGGGDDAARSAFAFRLVTGRPPTDAETRVLTRYFDKFRKDYAADPKAAADLLNVGAKKADGTLAAPDVAAATLLAEMLLNLDETVTKD